MLVNKIIIIQNHQYNNLLYNKGIININCYNLIYSLYIYIKFIIIYSQIYYLYAKAKKA